MNSPVFSDPILSLQAIDDQSARRGCFVKFNGAAAALVTSATDMPVGVLLDGDIAGGRSSVALYNTAAVLKVKCGATPGSIVPGSLLQLQSDGAVRLDAGTGARVLVGTALETGAAGALIDAILFRPALMS